jgi:hypothetical protein
MGYSRNFGFRSFENIVRDARSRIPHDSEDTWVLGTALVVDTENQGLVRKPEAGEAPHPGCGVLVYEHIQFKGFDPHMVTGSDLDTVRPGEYVQVVRGNGTKIWLRNTDSKTMYDGASRAAREMIDLGDAETLLGEYLTPTTDGTWEVGSAADGWLWVEQFDAETGLAECRFTF